MVSRIRVIYTGDIECVECKARNHVTVERHTETPSVPAVTEIVVKVEKATQTVLA